jgi:3-deoxy-D-manno-octulosonic-acid transferase
LGAFLHDPLVLALYRQLSKLSGPVIDSLLRRRLIQGKEDPDRVSERRGRTTRVRPEGALVWIHGASVGESLSILPLIDHMNAANPALHFVVTTGTLTSAHTMAERLPANATHQFVPLDHPSYGKSFIEHWRPDLGVIIESELWPNLILNAHQQRVPLVLANARLSEASFKGWRKAPKSIAKLLMCFDQVFAQDHNSADRLKLLGAQHVSVPGNLKDDALPLPYTASDLATLTEQAGSRPRWIAASTHSTEEAIAGRVHGRLKKSDSSLLTLIAPRHPARGNEIANELRDTGLMVAQRSQGEPITQETDIYLADTLGEMGLLYRFAEVAFIGGSFGDAGGHNPLEAARLDCALIFGPNMSNFDVSSNVLLDAAGALQVKTENELATAVNDLLGKKDKQRAQAQKAKETALLSTGAAASIGDALARYVATGGAE